MACHSTRMIGSLLESRAIEEVTERSCVICLPIVDADRRQLAAREHRIDLEAVELEELLRLLLDRRRSPRR